MKKLVRYLSRGILWVFAANLIAGCMQPRLVGDDSFDVVVLGGTSSGVAAAVQSARMGKSVVLVEAGWHLGGLSSGGLGATDIGNKKAIGGIAREFYHSVYLHYLKDDSWVYEERADYRRNGDPWRGGAESWDAEEAWWMFEPGVAEGILVEMIDRTKVLVVYGERLDLKDGVCKQGRRIVAIRTESGRVFKGKMFIDATYEGDLMELAGVSYTVGRESNNQYGESLNGVQTRQARSHQFDKPVDPYVKQGEPSSGLLPGVGGHGPGQEGSGDHRVQAYNFRLCLTDVAENQVPFSKPADYDPLRYELLFRYYEAGFDGIPWIRSMMPNRKTDINNKYGFSSDNIGANYGYPEGDYGERERIIRDHVSYQMGLMWTLANHPRIPAEIREEVSKWGLAKDEFSDNANWPRQLYVREARRMVSDYVMTELNCRGRVVAEDSVGLGAYGMDSHHTQRYVDERGHVRNEGDVQVRVAGPYPISYRSIIPKSEQCSNLLVPVCVSASHIAYGSIRMEPVFMILGQSAASAACLAIDDKVSVQRLDYKRLRRRLLKDGQILSWE
ncbi:MAG: FAD-dependent oxidoreductase [Planctomycetota bacterium]